MAQDTPIREDSAATAAAGASLIGSRLGPRERQIVDLLLEGCDNAEIAKRLGMARRTVKAHFNRLFLRFGIVDGIKRVKLATLLYRKRVECEKMMASMAPAPSPGAKSKSSPSLPGA